MTDAFAVKRYIAVIIQASMGSVRFPGKSLADLNGKPLIEHVIERVKRIRRKHAVGLAVTNAEHDDPLWRLGHAHNLFVDRGKPKDLLGQYHEMAVAMSADVVVRVTGDCPVIDSSECDRTIEEFLKSDAPYVSNRFPVMRVQSGFDCEVFSAALLKEAHENATDAHDREHVTPWMVRNVMDKTLGPKLSVDTPADLERVNEWLRFSGK